MDRRGFLKGALGGTVAIIAAKLGAGEPEPEISQARLDEFAAAAKNLAGWGVMVAQGMAEVVEAMRSMQIWEEAVISGMLGRRDGCGKIPG